MSFGTVKIFKTKKALKEAVAEHGAANVMVRDTSMFDNRGIVSVADIADTSASICGPDVYRKRDWYAQVKTVKGEIRVV